MKFLPSFLLSVLLLAGFQACREKSSTHSEQLSGSGNTPILDSIKKLDSLAFSLRVRNDSLSVIYAKVALTLAKRTNDPKALVKAYNAIGNSFSTRHMDSSYYYYHLALKLAESTNQVTEIPILLYNIAMVNLAAFNSKGAIIFLDSAINIATKTGNYIILSNAYNSLGIIHEDIKDTGLAKNLFNKALQIGHDHSLPKQVAAALANLARFEKNEKDAISLQKSAIQQLKKLPGTEEELALAYINIGLEETNQDSAIFYYKSGLIYAKAGNLPLIEISAYNNLSYCYLDKGDIRQATKCIVDIAIPIARKVKNYDWLSTLYDSYADVLAKNGDFSGAFLSLRKSIAIKSNMEFSKNEKQLRLLFSILDLKNKEITIRENESEIKAKNTQNQVLKLTIVISILFIIIIIFLFIGFRQKTRIKNKQQQIISARRIIEAEEIEKKKLAMELHDTIGQYVMDTTGEIENADIPDLSMKLKMVENLSELSDKMRTLSHRMSLTMIEQISITQLVRKLCDDVRKFSGLQVNLVIPEMQPEISNEVKVHAFRIVQEMLSNATKYARNAHISLTLSFPAGNLEILYSDDGPGFEYIKGKEHGMGLMNIFERTNLVGGKAILDSAPGFGLFWKISIPLGKQL